LLAALADHPDQPAAEAVTRRMERAIATSGAPTAH
jgi:hypothetical protein